MRCQQVHLLLFVAAISVAAVGFVLGTAVLSIFIVFALKSLFAVIINAVAFIAELIIAVVAAITSGTTVTLSIVAAAAAAAVSFPASFIEARIGLSVAVSSAAIVASSTAVMWFTTLRMDAELAFAVVTAAATSVSFAAAWAVGVMSLIEKETHHVGLKMTSILDMVRRNNFRILKLMLKLPTGFKKRDLDVALVHAVKAGFFECAKVLLESGANPDARDSYDNSALLLACETGSYNIAKLLVDSNASVELHHAAGRGTAMHQAANWGSNECVRLLLSRSANPNAVDGLWRTPLMLAAMHAHKAAIVMQTLIDAGCDVNASGFEQKTALHYAAARGLDPVKLLEAGADPRTRDAAENSPLHAAAAGGHGPVVQALVPYSDPSATNNQGRTALHLSAAKGDVTCLEAIVEAAGPECCMAVDASRHLAVYYAAYNGHYDAAVFFIRVNAPLTNHITDLSFRDVHSEPDQSAAVSTNIAASDASSPLAAALEKRHMTVARALLIGGCENRALLSDWLLDVQARSGPWADDNAEHVDWLDRFAHAPCELSHLCRLVIRRVLGTRIRASTSQLPVPKKLQEYILLNELLTISVSDQLVSRER